MARTDTLGHFLTDVADAIRNKKGSSGTIQASSFDTEIASIPSGGSGEAIKSNDVNFYDYDGTILHSYTKSEFNNLQAMPDNPTHEGLTSMGWNWTFQEAKDYMTTHNFLEIGQVYQPSDASIVIYVSLDEFSLNPYISFSIKGTATIDWGDNTTPDTITGTSVSTVINTPHTYSSAGDYVIKITSTSDIRLQAGNTSIGSKFFWGGSNDDYSTNVKYIRSIEKIFFNNNVVLINNYTFCYCNNLKNIILPNNATVLGNNLFYSCFNLKHITIPKQNNYSLVNYLFYSCYSLKSISLSSTTQKIGQNTFQYCYALNRITMPNNLTTFSANMFQYSYITELEIPNNATNYSTSCFASLQYVDKIVINNTSDIILNGSAFNSCSSRQFIVKGNITSIAGGAFYNASACLKYDFTGCTSVPPLANVSAFYKINANCKIIVPDSLYEDWIIETNWSDLASYIVKASDYNEE